MRRALLSVYDKSGVVEFARGLKELSFELISSGGTAAELRAAGLAVTEVAELTGFPELLGGRVKTLHPTIHAGILARRDSPQHMEALQQQGIQPIDLVVVNLYPFERTVSRPGVSLEEAIENIDVGGPTLLRAAAKNHESVAVVCEPADYGPLLAELKAGDGSLSLQTRQRLAQKAFQHTAGYDVSIANWLACAFADEGPQPLPARLLLRLDKIQDLRYGENPHQRGGLYADVPAVEPGLPGARQLHGKELSYINILDLAAALEIVRSFEEPCCTIIKHTNPCGGACALTLAQALEEAWAGDPMSAFGGIIGFNRTVDAETAQRLGNTEFLKSVIEPRYRQESGDEESLIISAFVECVMAPGYEPEALGILRQKANLRVMELPELAPAHFTHALMVHKVPGGMVVQDGDYRGPERSKLQVVTKRAPTEAELDSMIFADIIGRQVKSNSIVLARGRQLVGVGAGQMNRLESFLIAAKRAGKRGAGAVLASDAFFPAADTVEAAARLGITAIIQPGGSRGDAEVVAAADAHELAMVFTGTRHFKH